LVSDRRLIHPAGGWALARLLTVLVFLLLAVFHEALLRWAGERLVLSEAPRPADAIVVLAGDFFGQRLLKGCELVRQGYASQVLVSGPKVFYGHHENELAIPWAVRHGCPAAALVGVPHLATSTRTEAEYFRDYLAQRGIRSYLLVTSDFHTRRAARVFRQVIPAIPVTVIAAPFPEYQAERWWRDRQSAKTFFFEWVKTVADYAGL